LQREERPGEITSTSKARKEQSLCLQGDEEENIRKKYGGWGREFARFSNIRSEMR
jgi:hypothetical protein